MDVKDKVVIVTGGANGIGKALSERFHKAGARKVVVADLEQDNAAAVAAAIDGDAFGVDVRDEQQIADMVARWTCFAVTPASLPWMANPGGQLPHPTTPGRPCGTYM